MLKEVRWRAPEFQYHEKGVAWYWLTIIIAFILVVISLVMKNFLFAVFLLIAETMIIFWGRQKPRGLEFRLDERGLAIGEKKFYPYGDLSGFASANGEVIFRHKGRFNLYTKTIVSPADAGRIESFLNGKLPVFEYRESLMDHIERILRF